MIPWFVAALAQRIARRFGFDVYTRATVGRFGCDRIYFVRRGEFGPLLSNRPKR
jgi:acetylornithine deacetylase/succinyl-diaminopimelate desuccinylase-like protein